MTISELKEQLRQRDLQLEKQAAQRERQAARIKKQAARIKELERKIKELKNLLVDKAKSKESKPPKEASNYSASPARAETAEETRSQEVDAPGSPRMQNVISPRKRSICIGMAPTEESMSIDKARGVLAFFTGLQLSKSQADSLLSQLATDWQVEDDAIAELIASAAILTIAEPVAKLCSATMSAPFSASAPRSGGYFVYLSSILASHVTGSPGAHDG